MLTTIARTRLNHRNHVIVVAKFSSNSAIPTNRNNHDPEQDLIQQNQLELPRPVRSHRATN
jgi:hypothetical protein